MYTVREPIVRTTQQALGHVLAAQSALAEQDYNGGEQQFKAAEDLLRGAQQDLDNALAASQSLLQWLDVTGRVRSGTNLLAAGELTASAGLKITRGLAALQEARPALPGENKNIPLLTSLHTVEEEFSVAALELKQADEHLTGVTTDLFPPAVQAHLTTLRAGLPTLRSGLEAAVVSSRFLRGIFGEERQRQYLLVFQNNHELRPTGGFIGSIALVNVDRGKVENIDVQSVYDPDGQLNQFIEPPEPLRSIAGRWYLRDANWFVDFATSASKITQFFEKEGGPTVDGVIAITPEVIMNLLKVTGPIEVPGYDVTVTSDNFVDVTQQQVTYEYDRELNRPKQFLADLVPLLLNRVLQGESAQGVAALHGITEAAAGGHVLAYFRDAQEQQAVHKIGWDGSFPPATQGFLSVNNANIGGHKTDQFVDQEIDYRSSVQDSGDVDITLTIRRTHRGPSEIGDREYPLNENPATKDNVVFQRVLVPRGAQLIEAQGFAQAPPIPSVSDASVSLTPDADVEDWQNSQSKAPDGTNIGEEAGYTFFGNWMVTKPGQTTVGIYRYRLPGHTSVPSTLEPIARYSVWVAKQPGDLRTSIRVGIELPANARIVHTLPIEGVTYTEPVGVVYRGQLSKDKVVGVVFE